ncbi:MAG TPA: permease, partial [Candidatus Bathyarchaeia archaeon]|nr:permease [Candidatus Bathyarchaeia archaeon]
IFSAIVIAMVSGLIYQILEKRGLVETNPNSTPQQDSFSIRADLKRRWAAYRFSLERLRKDARGVASGSLVLADMVLWWMLIGVGLASFAGAYVPQDFFHQYMGPTVWGMIVTLGLATVIEVCSEGSSPMAFEIFRHTGALGNSFVFLMAGVVTDYTEIGLLWHNIGRKAALWLPVISVPQVLLFGLLANIIF